MLESNAAAVRINSALNDLTISYNRKDRDTGNCVFEVHSCFVLLRGVKSMCSALSTLYCFVFYEQIIGSRESSLLVDAPGNPGNGERVLN